MTKESGLPEMPIKSYAEAFRLTGRITTQKTVVPYKPQQNIQVLTDKLNVAFKEFGMTFTEAKIESFVNSYIFSKNAIVCALAGFDYSVRYTLQSKLRAVSIIETKVPFQLDVSDTEFTDSDKRFMRFAMDRDTTPYLHPRYHEFTRFAWTLNEHLRILYLISQCGSITPNVVSNPQQN